MDLQHDYIKRKDLQDLELLFPSILLLQPSEERKA